MHVGAEGDHDDDNFQRVEDADVEHQINDQKLQ